MQLSLKSSILSKKNRISEEMQTGVMKSNESSFLNAVYSGIERNTNSKRGKLNTVKSLGISRQLNNSKYL